MILNPRPAEQHNTTLKTPAKQHNTTLKTPAKQHNTTLKTITTTLKTTTTKHRNSHNTLTFKAQTRIAIIAALALAIIASGYYAINSYATNVTYETCGFSVTSTDSSLSTDPGTSNVYCVGTTLFFTEDASGVYSIVDYGGITNHSIVANNSETVTLKFPEGSNINTDKIVTTPFEQTFDYEPADDHIQEFTVPNTGIYKMEAWGAEGGSSGHINNTAPGGKGAYASSYASLQKGDVLQVYVGGKGTGGWEWWNGTTERPDWKTVSPIPGGFNGGGNGSYYDGADGEVTGGGGGGASDVRLIKGDTVDALWSRIIVAGGGGGASRKDEANTGNGGAGGGGTVVTNSSTTPATAAASSVWNASAHDCSSYTPPPAGQFPQNYTHSDSTRISGKLGVGASPALSTSAACGNASGGGGGGFYGGNANVGGIKSGCPAMAAQTGGSCLSPTSNPSRAVNSAGTGGSSMARGFGLGSSDGISTYSQNIWQDASAATYLKSGNEQMPDPTASVTSTAKITGKTGNGAVRFSAVGYSGITADGEGELKIDVSNDKTLNVNPAMDYVSAINVSNDHTLSIVGDGNINAFSKCQPGTTSKGLTGAGIGSNGISHANAGTINFAAGNITAISGGEGCRNGGSGAGIGGGGGGWYVGYGYTYPLGAPANGGTVNIYGSANVTAIGGGIDANLIGAYTGAGIGGGGGWGSLVDDSIKSYAGTFSPCTFIGDSIRKCGNGGKVTIDTTGTVIAHGGDSLNDTAAGIGGGGGSQMTSGGADVTIIKGHVIATGGSTSSTGRAAGAGIGSGGFYNPGCGTACNVEFLSGSVNIQGGFVEASGGTVASCTVSSCYKAGSGIGPGGISTVSDMLPPANVEISGGTVLAKAGKGAYYGAQYGIGAAWPIWKDLYQTKITGGSVYAMGAGASKFGLSIGSRPLNAKGQPVYLSQYKLANATTPTYLHNDIGFEYVDQNLDLQRNYGTNNVRSLSTEGQPLETGNQYYFVWTPMNSYTGTFRTAASIGASCLTNGTVQSFFNKTVGDSIEVKNLQNGYALAYLKSPFSTQESPAAVIGCTSTNAAAGVTAIDPQNTFTKWVDQNSRSFEPSAAIDMSAANQNVFLNATFGTPEITGLNITQAPYTGGSELIISGTNFIKPTTSKIWGFTSTSSAKTFIAPVNGYYNLEAWGAGGGNSTKGSTGGKGGYSSGKIFLKAGEKINVYVGAAGTTNGAGWNGGGVGDNNTSHPESLAGGGGGATDFRLDTSLNSRILVAGGGGGAGGHNNILVGGAGGGVVSQEIDMSGTDNNCAKIPVRSATQYAQDPLQFSTPYQSNSSSFTASVFGIGASPANNNAGSCGSLNGGGGGGYWGGIGYAFVAYGSAAGGGGSSFVSGMDNMVAIKANNDTSPRGQSTGNTGADCTGSQTGGAIKLCSQHYSGYVFEQGTTEAGGGAAAATAGSARITLINEINVTVGGETCEIISKTVDAVNVSNGTIKCLTPPHKPGARNEVKVNFGDTLNLIAPTTIEFTGTPENSPVINTISPNAGPIIGGQTITITGTNLGTVSTGTTVPSSNNPKQDFYYTGGYQSFTAPTTGTYKFELWGASGGGNINYADGSGVEGGRGGYTVASRPMNAGQTVYIYVGGQGAQTGLLSPEAGQAVIHKGGYNGGGDGSRCTQSTQNCINAYSRFYGAGGGGATDIRSSVSSLADIAANTVYDNRLLIAGGGGGTSGQGVAPTGGAGGGTTGGVPTGLYGNTSNSCSNPNYTPVASTQSSGFKRGYGQTPVDRNAGSCYEGYGGGGGGLFGGFSYSATLNASTPYHMASAGGGSGYIETVTFNIAEGRETKQGTESMPRFDKTGTMAGNIGDGHARVTMASSISVTVDSKPCTDLVIISAGTQVSCKLPTALNSAKVDVVVSTSVADGVKTAGYEYVAPPSISGATAKRYASVSDAVADGLTAKAQGSVSFNIPGGADLYYKVLQLSDTDDYTPEEIKTLTPTKVELQNSDIIDGRYTLKLPNITSTADDLKQLRVLLFTENVLHEQSTVLEAIVPAFITATATANGSADAEESTQIALTTSSNTGCTTTPGQFTITPTNATLGAISCAGLEIRQAISAVTAEDEVNIKLTNATPDNQNRVFDNDLRTVGLNVDLHKRIPPVAPATQTITPSDPTSTGFKLTWNQATDNISDQEDITYGVYRSTNIPGSGTLSDWKELTPFEGNAVLAGENPGTASYVVTNTPGISYYYAVIATDEAGNSVLYNTPVQTGLYKLEFNNNPPSLASGSNQEVTGSLPTTAYALRGQDFLTTNAGSAEAAGFALDGWYASNSPSSGDQPVVAASATGVTVANANANKVLYAKWSDNQAPVFAPTITFQSPANGAVQLNWDSATDNVTPVVNINYKLCRSTSTFAGTPCQPTDARIIASGTNLLTYNDTTITNNNTYYYQVIAIDSTDHFTVSTQSSTAVYTVTFNMQGGSPNAATQYVITGNKASKPSGTDDGAYTQDGYLFNGWYDQLTEPSEEPDDDKLFDFIDTTITAATIIYASWFYSEFDLTFTTKDDKGNDLPSGSTPTYAVNVCEGDAITPNQNKYKFTFNDDLCLTQTAPAGFSFVGFTSTSNGVNLSGNKITAAPTNDVNIVATYSLISYALNYEFDTYEFTHPAPVDATAGETVAGSAAAYGLSSGSYKLGDTITVTFTPVAGYKNKTDICQWTGANSGTAPTLTKTAGNKCSFTITTSYLDTYTLKGLFEPITSTFDIAVIHTTAETGDQGQIYGKIGQTAEYLAGTQKTVKYGETVTLKCDRGSGEDCGSHFSISGGNIASLGLSGDDTQKTGSFQMPNSNVTVTASYEDLPGTLTISPKPLAGGTATSSVYKLGASRSATMTAIAAEGYTFAGWHLTAAGKAQYLDSYTDMLATNPLTINTSTACRDAECSLGFEATFTANAQAITYFTGWGANGSYTLTELGLTQAPTAGTHETYSVLGTPNPVAPRTGYDFAGWEVISPASLAGTTYKLGTANSSFTMPAQAVSIGAVWTKHLYIMSFNVNAGSDITTPVSTVYADSPLTVEYESTAITAPTTPIRSGYNFAGWYKSDNGGSTLGDKWIFGTTPMPATALTLYAKWTPIIYSINYIATGANSNSNILVDAAYKSTIATPTSNLPTLNGYTLAGWCKVAPTTNPGGVGTVCSNSWRFTEDEEEGLPADQTPIDGITLYAVWTGNSQNITYTLGSTPFDVSASLAGALQGVTSAAGSKYNLPTAVPSSQGYTFDCWKGSDGLYYKNGGSDVNAGFSCSLAKSSIVTPNNGFTFTAIWVAKTFNITFENSIAGSAVVSADKNTYHIGETVTIESDPAFGYAFASWTILTGTITLQAATTNADNSFVAKAEDVAIKANMVAENVVITPDMNCPTSSCTLSTDFTTQSYNTNYAALPTAIASGYEFLGWKNSSSVLVDSATVLNATSGVVYNSGYKLYLTAEWADNQAPIISGSEAITKSEPSVDKVTLTWAPSNDNDTIDGDINYKVYSSSTNSGSNISTWESKTKVADFFASTIYGSAGSAVGSIGAAGSTDVKAKVALDIDQNRYFVVIATDQTGNKTIYTPVNAYTHALSFVVPAAATPNTVNPIYIFDGNKATAPGAGNINGYTFDAWQDAQSAAVGQSAGELFDFNANVTASKTLYTRYYANSYQLNYSSGVSSGEEVNVGNMPASGSTHQYTSSTQISALTPTRIGYTFSKWVATEGTTGDYNPNGSIASFPAADVTLTAQWNKNTYAITITSTQACAVTTLHLPASVQIEHGEAASTALPATTCEGWSFDGWFLDSNHTEKYNESNAVVSAIVLFPFWTKEVTIKFSVGTLPELCQGTTHITPGDGSQEYDTPKQTGTLPEEYDTYAGSEFFVPGNDGNLACPVHKFGGWKYNGNTVYYAGDTMTIGSTFTGDDITLEVVWVAVAVNIFYGMNSGDANGAESYVECTALSDCNIQTNVPTKVGYDFDGWWFSDSAPTIPAEGSGAYTKSGMESVPSDSEPKHKFIPQAATDYYLVAHWSAKTVTVTYTPAGGTQPEPTSTVAGGSFNLPATPTRPGYLFNGWSAVGTGDTLLFNGTLPAESNINVPIRNTNAYEIIANWTARNLTIYFDVNGGTDVAPISATVGTTKTMTQTSTKPGYTFDGWQSATEGLTYNCIPYVSDALTNEYCTYEDGLTVPAIDTNITLTAKWVAKTTYNIVFTNASATAIDSDISTYGAPSYTVDNGTQEGAAFYEGQTVKLIAHPKTGYTFGSWSVTSGDVTLSPSNTAPNATFTALDNEVAITANYVPIKYNLTLTKQCSKTLPAPAACVSAAPGTVTATAAQTAVSAGTVQYIVGETVNLSATASTGYQLANFERISGATVAEDQGNYSFVGIAQNTEIVGNFEAITYNLTVASGANGKVSAAGGSLSATSTVVPYNIESSAISISAQANAGYEFSAWTASGLAASDTSATTTYSPSRATTETITGNFTAKKLLISSSIVGGVAGDSNALVGALSINDGTYNDQTGVFITNTVELEVSATSKYNFTSLTITDSEGTITPNITDALHFDFAVRTSNVSIQLNYTPKTYNVTTSAATIAGSINPVNATAVYGSNVFVDYTPNTSYSLIGWTVAKSNCGNAAENGTTNELSVVSYFVMPACDVVITAKTNNVKYPLTFNSSPAVATITGEVTAPTSDSILSGENRNAGETVELTAPVVPGYTFDSWTVSGISTLPSNPLATFAMPANAATVTANYVPIQYNVTFDLSPNNSIIAAAGVSSAGTVYFQTSAQCTGSNNAASSYTIGQTVYLCATPAAGFDAKGSQSGETTFTSGGATIVPTGSNGLISSFVATAQNVTVQAFFMPHKYTVTVQSANASHGTASTTPLSSPKTQFNLGEVVGLDTSPQTGYEFDHYDLGDGVGGHNNYTASTFTAAARDYTITAYFRLKTFTFDFESDPPNGGTVLANSGSTPISATMGQSINLAATRNEALGFKFIGWTASDGQTSYFANSEAASTTFTMPATDITASANFTLREFRISSVTKQDSSDNILGAEVGTATATPIGFSSDYAPIALTATVGSGYTFTQWKVYKCTGSTGDTGVPCVRGDEVTVTSATSPNATFSPADAIANVDVVAIYTPIAYNIGTSTVSGGTATVKVGTGTTSANATYNIGNSITAAATPAAGYEFSTWEVIAGDIPLNANLLSNPLTFNGIATAATINLRAVFTEIVYTASIQYSGVSHGYVTLSPATFVANTPVEVVLHADDGYEVKSVTITEAISHNAVTTDAGTSLPAGPVTFNAPYDDIVVTVEFQGAIQNLVYSLGDGSGWGTVPSPYTLTARTGESVAVKTGVPTYTDYNFTGWLISGPLGFTDSGKNTIDNNISSFTMPAGAVNLDATWQIQPCAADPTGPGCPQEPCQWNPSIYAPSTDCHAPTPSDAPEPTTNDDDTWDEVVQDAPLELILDGAEGNFDGVSVITTEGAQETVHIVTDGSYFSPNEIVQVWIFSDPTWIKNIESDESGNINTSIVIPPTIDAGEHHIVLNGVGGVFNHEVVAFGQHQAAGNMIVLPAAVPPCSGDDCDGPIGPVDPNAPGGDLELEGNVANTGLNFGLNFGWLKGLFKGLLGF